MNQKKGFFGTLFVYAFIACMHLNAYKNSEMVLHKICFSARSSSLSFFFSHIRIHKFLVVT